MKNHLLEVKDGFFHNIAISSKLKGKSTRLLQFFFSHMWQLIVVSPKIFFHLMHCCKVKKSWFRLCDGKPWKAFSIALTKSSNCWRCFLILKWLNSSKKSKIQNIHVWTISVTTQGKALATSALYLKWTSHN